MGGWLPGQQSTEWNTRADSSIFQFKCLCFISLPPVPSRWEAATEEAGAEMPLMCSANQIALCVREQEFYCCDKMMEHRVPQLFATVVFILNSFQSAQVVGADDWEQVYPKLWSAVSMW